MSQISIELKKQYRPPGRRVRECKYQWFDMWDLLVNSVLSCAGTPKVIVEPGEIAIDPHIHTLFSHCSISQPERILRTAAHLGLGAVAIMDHNDFRGADDAIACAEYLKSKGAIPKDFLVIPGVEANSTQGHIGALFVQQRFPILPPDEMVDLIHQVGGLAIANHPYHSTGIGDAVFDAPFDAVEVECGSVFGARLVEMNRALYSDPRLVHVPKIGSSDAHYVHAIASCYTVLTGIDEPTLEAVRQAFVDGRVRAVSSEPCKRMRRYLGKLPKLD